MGSISKDAKISKSIRDDRTRKALKENEVTLVLIPNEAYSEGIIGIAKMASSLNRKLCYVALNKPYKTLLREFRKGGVDAGKFFFIDCVTKNVKEEESEQVVYVSSPKALTEINIVMKKVLGMGKIESTILDSLSTLLVYEGSANVIRFAHSIISMFRSIGSKGILISLKEDMKSELIKDLNMFVDDTIELG